MNYKSTKIKLKIELLIMSPFVWLGKCYGRIKPLKSKYDTIFFFPSADIGGSPKVNLDIVSCIKAHKSCLIIFSKKPNNNLFLDRFQTLGVDIIDLHQKIDNKLLHFLNFFYRGVVAAWVNAQQKPTIFGGECIFFYKVVPHVDPNVRCIELCHLATWMDYTAVFIDKIDVRVFSTLHLLRKVQDQYTRLNIGKPYTDRLLFLDNTIDIPEKSATDNDVLQLIFVGRGSPQKRPELIAKIAKVLHDKEAPVHFSFIGDVELIFDPQKYPFCTFYGNVKDEAMLMDLYRSADALVLTSAFEGLPIVVMQMMAFGKVVLSTAVGGIPDYITDKENGLLIWSPKEDIIIEQGVSAVERLLLDKDLRSAMGEANREKAIRLFGKETFCRHYSELLLR